MQFIDSSPPLREHASNSTRWYHIGSIYCMQFCEACIERMHRYRSYIHFCIFILVCTPFRVVHALISRFSSIILGIRRWCKSASILQLPHVRCIL